MSDHTETDHGDTDYRDPPANCVHETLIRDWAAEGLDAAGRYLAKHAAFAAFLDARSDLESNDGAGGADRVHPR